MQDYKSCYNVSIIFYFYDQHMKKIIVAFFIFCYFPLLTYAAVSESDYALPSQSASSIIGTFFSWILIIATPLLILTTIILGIKHFFKKDIKSEKELPTSSLSMMAKLIVPYSVFAGMFVFINYQRAYLCGDCFENYGIIVSSAVAIIFLVGSIWLMKKNNKEWKILYTLLFIISFLIAFYSIMAIGEYFYVPDGF